MTSPHLHHMFEHLPYEIERVSYPEKIHVSSLVCNTDVWIFSVQGDCHVGVEVQLS